MKLVGLPPKVTTPEMEITKDTKEIAFKLTIDKTSPAGQHSNLFCQVVRRRRTASRSCTTSAARELRIDVPLPPKATPRRKPATPMAAEAADAAQPPREAADAAGEAAAGAGRAREGGARRQPTPPKK